MNGVRRCRAAKRPLAGSQANRLTDDLSYS
jgi:hypothetical protein